MSFDSLEIVDVYFYRRSERLLVGRLAWKDRRIFFEYDDAFIKTELELSPFYLPLKKGVQGCEDFAFEGLFGVFNDSLPDGWGRLLLDRKLRQLRINPDTLTPLDRLRFVGENGMGALAYAPVIKSEKAMQDEDLDEVAREIYAFQEKDDDRFLDELIALNGSSAGARPKIMMTQKNADWIVKFKSSLDPEDVGAIEYAYHLMAEAAGLEVPEAKLFTSKRCPGYFGCERFDRNGGERIHMHTVSGLIYADHRLPNLDYETILKVTHMLTKDMHEVEKQFRAAVFNVFSHNRDDHAKNFSFLMNEQGMWRVSPAYDLTFSSGPGGEHCTMVLGEGKKPQAQHLKALAAKVGLKEKDAGNIINQVQSAVTDFTKFAKQAGVGRKSLQLIRDTLAGVF